MSGGKLILVPTPIGNLGDMTPRAIDVLKSCHTVLAEDTRTTGKLLRHFGVDAPSSRSTSTTNTGHSRPSCPN